MGLLLWAVLLWATGFVRVWYSPVASGALRIRLVSAPGTVVGLLVAVLAFVVFADHLRRVRGTSDLRPPAS